MLLFRLSTSILLLVTFFGFVFPLNPVIFVPGDGGSQIEGKLDKTNRPDFYCSEHTSHYYTLWLNMWQLFFRNHCLMDNLRLVYNETTRKTENSPGVSIRVPGFGNTDTVEFIDPHREHFTAYFHHIVERLIKEGYERNFSLRGAPYDFRRSPNEFQDYFSRVKELILETYKANNNSKVILICHSMGSPTMLYFLNHQSQAWKDTYIRSLVTISGVWGGAVKSIRAMSSGVNLGHWTLDPLVIRIYLRSASSTAWLMPYDTFWGEDEILVSRPERNYTVKDYKQLFDDLEHPIGYMMREDTENLVKELTPPGVEVFCIHGAGVSTPEQLVYHEGFPDEQPDTKYGAGDGTGNLRSLLGCLRWQKQQPQPVHHYVIPGAEHTKILKNKRMIDYLIKEVVSQKCDLCPDGTNPGKEGHIEL